MAEECVGEVVVQGWGGMIVVGARVGWGGMIVMEAGVVVGVVTVVLWGARGVVGRLGGWWVWVEWGWQRGGWAEGRGVGRAVNEAMRGGPCRWERGCDW